MTMPESLNKSDLAQLLSQEIIQGSKSTSEEWKLNGVCRTIDPELWFPGEQQTGAEAKRWCKTCPVMLTCLQYAIENAEPYGVWGGMTANERKLFRRLVVKSIRNANY